MAIATAGGVYISIRGLQQSQDSSMCSHRQDASCFCNGQTDGALYVEQTSVNECKPLGDGTLYNATHCESFS